MAFSGVGVIEHAPASFEEANLRCMTARTTFLREIAAHVTCGFPQLVEAWWDLLSWCV